MKNLLHILLCICAVVSFSTVSYAQTPVASFTATPTSGCSPIVVQFTNTSTGGGTYSWDLGNGTIITSVPFNQSISTTYITPGSYTVTLTATNSSGTNVKVSTNFISVTPSPTVNFIVNDSTISCAPKTVHFTNSSLANVSGPVTYYWDFGDGTNDTTANPNHTYNTGGNFTITLIVTNSIGCSKTLTKSNYVKTSKPTANFTGTNISSCTLPLTSIFTNTSTGTSGVTNPYTWYFGDGTSSTSTSPSHTYNAVGAFNVTLIATNSDGCKDTIVKPNFVIVDSLSVGFSTNITTTCLGNSINFNNSSTPTSATSSWNFGDATTSFNTSPVHTYAAAGTYNVKLVVHYNACSDSIAHSVTIYPKPTLTFTAAQTSSCSLPFTTQFTSTTTNANTYSWDFGDGGTATSANPGHTYNTNGVFTVKLVVTSPNGCVDSFIRPAYINVAPVAYSIVANGAGCAPSTLTFGISPYNSTIATCTWNFGDGNSGSGANINHTYTAVGTYNVTFTFTTTSGCSVSSSIPIVISSPPVASFSATPTTACTNTPISFTNNSTSATTYTWIFGDGATSNLTNPSHAYSNPGTYTVKLVASNGGCSDTMTIPNYITINFPLALFVNSINCANRKQITFTNLSSNYSTLLWDFGDGSPTNTTNGPLVHVYPNYGVYTATITAHNNTTGCTSIYTQPIKIFNLDSFFTTNKTSICKGDNITFTADTNSVDYIYNWDFGDGTTQLAAPYSVTHTYTTGGIYTAKLVVKDYVGCSDSMVRTSYIHVAGPTVAFTGTPLSGCKPLVVTFTDQTTPAAGISITSRKWDFGDGNTLLTSATTVIHSYTFGGVFTVKLVEMDAGGCSDSVTKVNYISVTQPIAAFAVADTNVCGNTPISFVNSSTGAAPLTYSWLFGDGGTSSVTNPVHTYTTTGNYTASLILTDGTGCKDTLKRPVHSTVVTANFSRSDSVANCPPLNVVFTNTSVGNTINNWNLGNTNTSVLTNATALYSAPATYTITLNVSNSYGCKDSISKTVIVHPSPSGTLSYNPIAGCSPLTITFSTTNANTNSLTWDMNNGFTTTQVNSSNSSIYTYTFNNAGTYLPKLILSSGPGCNVSLIGNDTIKVAGAHAGFIASPNPICTNIAVQFTDTSSVTSGTLTTRNWSFGDGNTSLQTNPSHPYSSPGTYTVRLIVSTATGCADTAYKTIVVNTVPSITVPSQSICTGASIVLTASGAANYTWSPGTGLSSTTGATVTANPTVTTTYTVTGSSGVGCTGTGTTTITVNPLPAISAGSNTSFCSGGSVQLNATGTATSYSWTPASGLSNATIANPVASPTNTTTYTVTGFTNKGCTDSAHVIVAVNALPTINAGANQSICPGGTATLTATGGVSYSWTPTSSLSSPTSATTNATPTATTTYTVVGTGSNGCTNSSQVTVSINAQPTITVSGNTSFCQGVGSTLTAGGATTYTWTPTTGLSSSNTATTVANPSTTTTYTVTGTSGVGCTGTTQVTVTVNPLPAVVAGPNQAICMGSSALLQASGASSYSWAPAATLTSSNTAATTATPATTTTYTVTGTSNGCSNTSSLIITVKPLPGISAGVNQFMCPGNTVNLLATGGVSYVWSPTAGLGSPTSAATTASPASTTTYLVTGTGSNGCVDTSHVTVTVNTQPVIIITGNTSTCLGTAVAVNASGAQSYSWSPVTGVASPTSGATSIQPATTTTYTVTGTSGVGCFGTAQITITVHPIPSVSATASNYIICSGASTVLHATGGVTYSWAPSGSLSSATSANPTASPTVTTNYIVTGTDAFGCVDTGLVTVNLFPTPNVTASANAPGTCLNSSLTLTAAGGQTYTWSPATGLNTTTGTTVTASPTTTTTYVVTGTDVNGCTDTGIVTATIYQPPTVNAGPPQAICVGNAATLTATGALNYVWSPTTGLSTATAGTTIANPTTTTTYTVLGIDVHNCSSTSQVTVTVHALPIVSAGPNFSACLNTPITLAATGATTYSWTPATGLNTATGATVTATPLVTTTYAIAGTDGFGCIGIGHVTDTVKTLPQVNAGAPVSICKGNGAQLQATGAASYAWTPSTGLNNPNIPNPFATPNVPTTYTATGTGANGCINTATVLVTIYAQPLVNAGPDQTICEGKTASLLASGASIYTWSPGATLSCTVCQNPVAAPAVTSNYHLVGVDSHGCVDSDDVNITVILKVPTSIAPGGEICEGGSFQLHAYGGANYTWTPAATLDNTTVPSPNASPTNTTTYHVAIKENECFTDYYDETVTVHPKPVVNAGPDQTIVAGASALIKATGTNIQSYLWSPVDFLSCTTCSNPTSTPDKTITYTVYATSPFGCKTSDSVTIFVHCDGSQIWLPNTFTPNADQQNDVFYPHGKGLENILRFRIYDRWGEIVFDAQNIPPNDKSYGWDGYYKNHQIKPDVYIYVLNALCSNGEPIEVKGDVTLLR